MMFKGNNRGRMSSTNERIALDKAMLEAYSKHLTSAEQQRIFLAALTPRDCMRLIGLVSCRNLHNPSAVNHTGSPHCHIDLCSSAAG